MSILTQVTLFIISVSPYPHCWNHIPQSTTTHFKLFRPNNQLNFIYVKLSHCISLHSINPSPHQHDPDLQQKQSNGSRNPLPPVLIPAEMLHFWQALIHRFLGNCSTHSAIVIAWEVRIRFLPYLLIERAILIPLLPSPRLNWCATDTPLQND